MTVSGTTTLDRHRSVSLHHRCPNRRSVESRRCPSCKRGMALVKDEGGRWCQYCGWEPELNLPTEEGGDGR